MMKAAPPTPPLPWGLTRVQGILIGLCLMLGLSLLLHHPAGPLPSSAPAAAMPTHLRSPSQTATSASPGKQTTAHALIQHPPMIESSTAPDATPEAPTIAALIALGKKRNNATLMDYIHLSSALQQWIKSGTPEERILRQSVKNDMDHAVSSIALLRTLRDTEVQPLLGQAEARQRTRLAEDLVDAGIMPDIALLQPGLPLDGATLEQWETLLTDRLLQRFQQSDPSGTHFTPQLLELSLTQQSVIELSSIRFDLQSAGSQ